MINEAITEKLDIKRLISNSNTFCIADFGCLVGPNTFIAMQSVPVAIEKKYLSQALLVTKFPEFHVFLNDHATNDFNTLFTSLPRDRKYFAAGVPGSFRGPLFPESSLHFAYSSLALQWLSNLPQELLDKTSLAWNGKRIHYTSTSEEVANAYAAQFTKDMNMSLNARANEIVAGGMMVLILKGVPDDMHYSQLTLCLSFDFFLSTLMDMVNEGLVSEAQVDSFNLPVYFPSPKELTKLVEENGCFSIGRMELMDPTSMKNCLPNAPTLTLTLRAALEEVFAKHFGSEIASEMLGRTFQRSAKLSRLLDDHCRKEITHLFSILMRK